MSLGGGNVFNGGEVVMSSPKILTFNEQTHFNLMDKFMQGKGTAKQSCAVAGSESDQRVAFHSLLHAATPAQEVTLESLPGGSCGGVGGCWATPSTVSPQAPPASCPSPASGDSNQPGVWVLRAHLLFLLFCCNIQLQRRCAHQSQPVPTSDAYCWGP